MILPKRVRIDACTICQLKCPCCKNGQGKLKDSIVGHGFLSFENFKRFVEMNPFIEKIELANWGEVFLNPELGKIIAFAHENGVKLAAKTGTNFNNVSDEMLELLVKCEFDSLVISLDGASNETYSFYRRGGNFDTVIENIKKLNNLKTKFNSNYPKLYWQFVMMGHNEHELPKARKLAEELGMGFMPKLNWSESFSPVKDKEFVRRETGLGMTSRNEYEEKNDVPPYFPCLQLWKTPQINWDGKLLGCCSNNFKDFGINVFEVGLKRALNSKKFIYAKKMLLDEAEPDLDIPCANCQYYSKFLVMNKNKFDLT